MIQNHNRQGHWWVNAAAEAIAAQRDLLLLHRGTYEYIVAKSPRAPKDWVRLQVRVGSTVRTIRRRPRTRILARYGGKNSDLFDLARDIAYEMGEGHGYAPTSDGAMRDVSVYEDDVIRITAGERNLRMEIVYRLSPGGRGPIENPVVLSDPFGTPIRMHGETQQAAAHLRSHLEFRLATQRAMGSRKRRR